MFDKKTPLKISTENLIDVNNKISNFIKNIYIYLYYIISVPNSDGLSEEYCKTEGKVKYNLKDRDRRT